MSDKTMGQNVVDNLLEHGVRDGIYRRAGTDADGEQLYTLTAKGSREVERMIARGRAKAKQDRASALRRAAMANGHLKEDGKTHRHVAAWQCRACQLTATKILHGPLSAPAEKAEG